MKRFIILIRCCSYTHIHVSCCTYIYSIPFNSLQPVPEMHMQDRPNSGLNIKDKNLLLLLFADDMVVLRETPEDAIYLLILSRSISDHHLRCGVGG